jgi:branched-chain amino acid transport system permease protein
VAIRRSPFGYRLLAMKDSPAACATLGLNLTRTKLAVFTISAAMAGVGGALYGGALRVADAQVFSFFNGLPILLIMVVAGIATVGGAMACGIILGAPLLANLFPGLSQLQLVLSGLAGIGMAKNPNGFVLDLRRRWDELQNRPVVAAGVAAGLVGVWVMRIGHLFGNWPYAVITLAILAVGPQLATLNLGRRAGARGGARARPDAAPLEWLGITTPFTPAAVAELDRALALPAAAWSTDGPPP